MNQKKIDELPEHLKGIEFKPYHFYQNKKAKGNEQKLLLQDVFVDEVMRAKGLHFTSEITRVVPWGENQIYVEAKVVIYQRYEVDGNKIDEKQTTAFASMTRMPHSDGQTHFAQMCITRARKTATLRHLGLSAHDILLAIEAYEIDKNMKRSSTRVITDEGDDDGEPEEKEQVIEPIVDANLSLDDI